MVRTSRGPTGECYTFDPASPLTCNPPPPPPPPLLLIKTIFTTDQVATTMQDYDPTEEVGGSDSSLTGAGEDPQHCQLRANTSGRCLLKTLNAASHHLL